jgi:hypothetical protein
MKRKAISAMWVLALLLLLPASPVAAQDGASSVFVPGWIAWVMVILALALPLIVLIYLRGKDRV